MENHSETIESEQAKKYSDTRELVRYGRYVAIISALVRYRRYVVTISALTLISMTYAAGVLVAELVSK